MRRCLDCPRLVASGSRCATCRSAANRARGSATERGYDSTHRRVRQLVLERDGWQCQIRGPRCVGVADSFDHIIPKAAGGETTVENGQAACTPCNSGKRDR